VYGITGIMRRDWMMAGVRRCMGNGDVRTDRLNIAGDAGVDRIWYIVSYHLVSYHVI